MPGEGAGPEAGLALLDALDAGSGGASALAACDAVAGGASIAGGAAVAMNVGVGIALGWLAVASSGEGFDPPLLTTPTMPITSAMSTPLNTAIVATGARPCEEIEGAGGEGASGEGAGGAMGCAGGARL